ncbi:ABC transporter permease [Flexilinea flocculi]|jgi:peptide/nickel transport system permease protein|uniref:ABC-type dipeptide/oligopeptide/nickel transport system, permease component n=1 Tax=Flexilinea flocculi TaxID=1678840 RepID=A0A0S7BLP7_9CHLR|nr:ABC transporter permease [Flexilinea flocculi]NMB92832.1 ABC transporter permease [Flexilinea flocculi]GAP41244.1 ABC-type dipeptide/oligopeptide/nickel transport system, permease component [Flexilinea flocculi]
MASYIAKRLLVIPLLLLVFSIVIFFLIQAPPGDFMTTYSAILAGSGSSMDNEQLNLMRIDYGLDKPMHIQYIRWMGKLLHGDMGLSLLYMLPNTKLIGDRIGLTVLLAFFSFILSWLIAIPAGIYSATHKNSIGDYFFTVINYIGVAIPNFFLALLLMWICYDLWGLNLVGLFSPKYEMAPWSWAKVGDLLSHIWLPSLILALGGSARLTRIMRANLLDELGKPYMITGRAKGMSEWALVMKYPVRLAINPLVSTIGNYIPQLFSGSLVVATVMNLQNIGPLLLQALSMQDMYLSGSILLVYCLLAIIGTILSDMLLVWVDPRIRME